MPNVAPVLKTPVPLRMLADVPHPVTAAKAR